MWIGEAQDIGYHIRDSNICFVLVYDRMQFESRLEKVHTRPYHFIWVAYHQMLIPELIIRLIGW